MNSSVRIILAFACFGYFSVFFIQEKLFQSVNQPLLPVPHHKAIKAVGGYLSNIIAEIIFVKSTVYLGGVHPTVSPRSYSMVLANNYYQIANLYPEFVDTYYFAQAFLPYIDKEHGKLANSILDIAIEAYPDNQLFPFYKGTNLFQYMGEPLLASEVFRKASKLKDAPELFSHLSIILALEGGQLEASLIALNTLIKSSTEETVIKRYNEEVKQVEVAIQIQKAVHNFYNVYREYPKDLNELVPDFFSKIPSFGTSFELTYNAPIVGLKRPDH